MAQERMEVLSDFFQVAHPFLVGNVSSDPSALVPKGRSKGETVKILRALVKKLVERMLSICTRFTEYYRPGGVMKRLPEPVYTFAVAFHIELLQVCRKADKCLAVWKHRRERNPEDIAFEHSDQGIEEACVCADVGIEPLFIRLMGPGENV